MKSMKKVVEKLFGQDAANDPDIVSLYEDSNKIFIEDLCNKVMNLGMEVRQGQLQGFETRSGNEALKELLDKELYS